MSTQRTWIMASALMCLFVVGSLQGCGGEDLDADDSLGKAEVDNECKGQFIANKCYSPNENITLSFYAISASLGMHQYPTAAPWDDWSDQEFPEPVVYMELFDAEYARYHGGRTTKYLSEEIPINDKDIVTLPTGRFTGKPEAFGIDLEKDPFQLMSMSGEEELLRVPLSLLQDPKNYLRVEDHDFGISDVMGRCSINPTVEELAAGIISAKDCYSEVEFNGVMSRQEGDRSNVREVIIGINVVESSNVIESSDVVESSVESD